MAIVQAWQSGALSRDSMLDIFRRGEVLPEGRTNEEEVRLIAIGKPAAEGADNGDPDHSVSYAPAASAPDDVGR